MNNYFNPNLIDLRCRPAAGTGVTEQGVSGQMVAGVIQPPALGQNLHGV